MSLVIGSPALRLLARRKLRGQLRRQVRRLRTPKGAAMALIGALLFTLWIAVVQLSPNRLGPVTRDPDELRALIRVGGLCMLVLTLGSSLTHRGLFLPSEEIERLFSAPLSRADTIRYRLWVNAGRALLAGVLLGVVFSGTMPRPVYAFAGVVLAMQSLPILTQAVAILAGGLEARFVRRLQGWPFGLVRTLSVLLGALVFVVLAFGGSERDSGALELFSSLVAHGGLTEWLEHPVVHAVTLPLEPWALAITAPDAVSFVTWGGVCLAIWAVLFELTARLPVDYRELSLETSAKVAERIRRHRRVGGGASASRVSALTRGWRVPWLFGRGPAGAIAWRKCVAIVRKARGTLVVSVLVLFLVTLFASVTLRGSDPSEVLGGAALVVVLGTVYLGAGLRFDFREDLDRMELVKLWPQPGWRVFTATLLPQVLLVTVLEVGCIGLRAAATGHVHPGLLGVAAAVPLFVFAWFALDNAVFLYAPTRFVAGQEGALHNAGRAVVLMFLRGLVFGALGLVVFAAAAGAFMVGDRVLGLGRGPVVAATAIAAFAALALCDGALAAIGGRLVRRFDVARDRG